MVKSNSDALKASSEIHPSSLTELGCRISAVIDALKNRTKAAKVAERSTDMLAKYEKGTSEPPFMPLARMCLAADIRMEWLATGDGEMRGSTPQPASGKDSQPGRPDADLLRAAAEVMERALDQAHANADAAGRAELLVAIYDMLQSGLALEAAGRAVAGMLRAAARSTGVLPKQG